MNHKTDMREALQLCIDAMLHDGVPTDPYHPRRVALNAAEAALAFGPDAQADERGALMCERLRAMGLNPANEAADLIEQMGRAAAPQAEAAQGVPEPIYQTRWGIPETVWGDVDKATYDDFESFGYAARRIVYAAAPAPVSETTGEMTVTEALMRDLLTHGIAIHRIVPTDFLAEPAPVSEPEQPSERGEQECTHGVDDGACKQCYGEAVRGEQGAALSDDVRAFLENLAESGSEPLNSAVAYRSREDRAYFSTEIRSRAREVLAASAPALGEQHTDDLAVDSFARAMKEKMAVARAKGRSGWEGTEPSELSRMLCEHVEKGDPRDVANFCMMLWHHSAQIASQPQAAEPKGLTYERAAFEAWYRAPACKTMDEIAPIAGANYCGEVEEEFAFQAWQARALLAHQPTQSVSNSTLQSRIIAAIHDLAATKPEAGEDWENWYIAAMDLLPGRVAEIFERAKGSGNAE